MAMVVDGGGMGMVEVVGGERGMVEGMARLSITLSHPWPQL